MMLKRSPCPQTQ